MKPGNFTLCKGLCAASAVHALHDLQAQRSRALATMKAHIRNDAVFSAASRQEATLAVQIRRARRHRNGADVPLTVEDRSIFHRASERQEREYRIADRTDAEVVRNRLLAGGGVVLAVAKGIGPAVVRR